MTQTEAADALWEVVRDWARQPSQSELLTSPLAYRARIERIIDAVAYEGRCLAARRIKDYAEDCYSRHEEEMWKQRAEAAEHCAYLVHESERG